MLRCIVRVQKHNTEHDKPYWRGPIWININYMALAALHHYRTSCDAGSAVQGKAQQLYEALHAAVVGNIYLQFTQSGFLWEQYHQDDGHGQGTKPFTGWTALVTLLLGERYP